MPKGISYLSALLGLLLLSSALLGAFSCVLKALSMSHQSVAALRQQMLLTDLYQSSLQQSNRCDEPCTVPNPAWQHALTELQTAMPTTEFHLCDSPKRLSWFAAQPNPRLATAHVCVPSDNQAQEIANDSGL